MRGPLWHRVARRAVLAHTASALGLCPARAQAGAFNVSPVRIALSQTHPTAILTMQNNGDQAVVVQIEVMAWSQADGKDIYTLSRDLLANPPIFTLVPQGTQIVRIGLRR